MISYSHDCEVGRLDKQERETGACQEPSRSCVPVRKRKVRLPTPTGGDMDNTTLLIILIVVIIVLGGGWYGRGRWY